ncbi:hypothetical protein Taro_005260 [Colocasia esculenta]|uniref:Pentatricopeptide repeat-containing protein n=1 Tax=Colocasia esculenta TaxID=4460 RepID=A0A843TTT4_COLES|nr:hypothetical protein [Colocasia esculenta]
MAWSSTAGARALSDAVRSAAGQSRFREALAFYTALHRSSSSTNPTDTFAATSALKSCARLPSPRSGAALHAHLRKLGFAPSDVYVHTALVDLYGRTSGPVDAWKLFDEMPGRSVIPWNALLSACVKSGWIHAARELFEDMPVRDIISWNTMVSGYAKAGDMTAAVALFQRIPEKNSETWNGMISGYVEYGDMESARKLFDEMPEKSNVSWTVMIGGYARQGDVDAARLLFDKMGSRERFAWNAMIACYAQNGRPREALRLFNRMLKVHVSGGAQPDEKTFSCLLSACSQLGHLRFGRWLESYIANVGVELDDQLRTAFVDLYAKCGSIDRAFELFNRLGMRDVVSYSAMIVGCGINGKSTEAIYLYKQMLDDKISPNEVTFMGLLTAYSHAGLVEEGCKCFASMANDHGVTPLVDHYAIMVDLFGRAGQLKEAYNLIRSMPTRPHAGVWGALLLACRLHGNVELGEVAAEAYSELEPDSNAHSVVLANIYAAAGKWDNARRLWKVMEERGMSKIEGCSWAEPG